MPVATWKADHGLDAVEHIPRTKQVDDDGERALVCGYTLQGDVRIGGVYIVCVHLPAPADGDGDSVVASIEQKCFLSLPGVLDARVLDGGGLAALACADGSIRGVSMASDNLAEVWRHAGDGLATSVSVVGDGRRRRLLTTSTTGVVTSMSTAGDDAVELGRHEAEAWCADAGDDGVVYSGGDDGMLRVFDSRADAALGVCKLRAHGGVGVTTVVRRGAPAHVLWTGGYDDTVRVWDVRALRKPLHSAHVGGGVWRLKFEAESDDSCSRRVLAACMYGGLRVLHVDDANTLALRVGQHYDKHESIAYGACWLPGGMALSASFYDNALHLWRPQVAQPLPQSQPESNSAVEGVGDFIA